LLQRAPEAAAAVVRAVVNTQEALKRDYKLAASVGKKLFPASEATLIAELVRRDLPYYNASISEDFVAGMNEFTRDIGLLKGNPAYSDVVATQMKPLWASATAA
jgi:NitT/TauT family transport system substrate-binding protein